MPAEPELGTTGGANHERVTGFCRSYSAAERTLTTTHLFDKSVKRLLKICYNCDCNTTGDAV